MSLNNEIDLSVEQLPQNPIILTPQDETDYNSLINKPKINNVTLVGNKTSSDLGLASAEQGEKADSAVQPADLSVYRTSDDQDIIDSTKQDTITDLATIRSGASAGATAVQPGDLATVATSGMYSDLTGKPGAATVDTLGLVKPDGDTIVVTEDGTISSVSGSGFDFEGTKAEFDAAVASGTITADSVSLITDDVDGANVATKAELQAVDRSKADTALSNVLANIDYVVESYKDGTNWYRVYNSGWVEQGGQYRTTTTQRQTFGVITFLKPFTDTNYTVQAVVHSPYRDTTYLIYMGMASIGNKTTTKVDIGAYGISEVDKNNGFDWYACGQGAE